MKYNFKTSEDDKILGLESSIESTGYKGGDGSKTTIKIEDTTVWEGYLFDIEYNRYSHQLIINANGDLELQDLIKSLKWLTNKLEIIEKDDKG
jgi:hypothetical protein